MNTLKRLEIRVKGATMNVGVVASASVSVKFTTWRQRLAAMWRVLFQGSFRIEDSTLAGSFEAPRDEVELSWIDEDGKEQL